VIIPGSGRQTGRSASWVPVPGGIAFVPVQLRFYGRTVTAEFECEGESAGPATHCFFLVRLQTDSTIRRLRIP
jgi:hypothetical protein